MKISKVIHHLLIICIAFICTQVNSTNLPSLGSQNTLEQTLEGKYISEVFLYELYPYIVNDPELSHYIQTLGNRLVLSSPQLQDPMRFHLINDPSVNAFAVPGGFIGIHVGLFLLANNESELAGVMAHEIAHIAQKHYQRNKEEMARVMIMNTAALLAAIQAVSSSNDPGVDNLGTAIIAGSLALTTDKFLQFSRLHEEEADRLGMDILVNSGFSPTGMPDFFAQLALSSKLYQQPPEFMSTHPVTESRIADTRFRANDINSKALSKDSLNFQIMKIKLRILTTDNNDQQLQSMQHELVNADETEKLALQYGIALNHLQQQNFAKSFKLIKQLRKQDPAQISFRLLEADYYLQRYRHSNKQTDKHVFLERLNYIYSSLEQQYPQNYPITAYHAESLIQTEQARAARDLLRNYLAQQIRPDSAELFRLLAMAEWQLGNSFAHMDAMSQYHFWRGDIYAAIRQLTIALENEELTPLQRQRLGDRLSRYQSHASERDKIFR